VLPSSPDLEDVDALQTVIAQLLTQLNSELERTRQFSADAAHELRTPLSKILAEIELLLESDQVVGDPAEALGRVHRTATGLGTLVNQLLILASGASDQELGLVSVSDVADEVVGELSSQQRDRVQLDNACDGLVRGSRSLLVVALGNALGNALKFSKDAVVMTIGESTDEVIVRVDDDGPGVDAAQRQRVFDHLYRAPEQRGRAGHGIGLALVAHITELHHGQVSMVERLTGARLELRLPRYRPES
jgi:signal transduction histidine kinase